MTALNAANSFTPPVHKVSKQGYSVSISGTFVGTITIQRSKDKTNWFDIGTFTGPRELDGEFGTAYYLRAGFKTGEYTSGMANIDVY